MTELRTSTDTSEKSTEDILSFKRISINAIYDTKCWRYLVRIGKFRLYLTWNCRMKPHGKRDKVDSKLKMTKHRKQVYSRAEGKCEICGARITMSDMEAHHVLPLFLFRGIASDNRNMLCLCKDCHAHIHKNPYANIELQEVKAKEFGIDLKEYYCNTKF